MKYSDMAESLEIFINYGLSNEFFSTDHDVIYGPSLDVSFSEEDRTKMETLGWIESDEYDCWCCFC